VRNSLLAYGETGMASFGEQESYRSQYKVGSINYGFIV